MTGTTKITRLVYGKDTFPSPEFEAVVMDADTAATFARASSATTNTQYAQAFYDMTWAEYLNEFDLTEEEKGKADDPFVYGEWLFEPGELLPQEMAWFKARLRFGEILEEHPELRPHMTSGGSSPGANMDQISGTLEALEQIAAQIDGERDGFILERDDEAVAAPFPAWLY